MKFYILYAQTGVSDYILPGPEMDSVLRACRKSEFQYLDNKKLICSIGDEGLEFPDLLIYGGCAPLISEVFKQTLDDAGISNLFYKPVLFKDEGLLIEEPYWLSLPPRIECLDKDKSVIKEIPCSYRDPETQFREVTQITIDEGRTGNYQIFKLPYMYANQEIIINENLYKILKDADLENVYFSEL